MPRIAKVKRGQRFQRFSTCCCFCLRPWRNGKNWRKSARAERPAVQPGRPSCGLTVFQVLACVQLVVAMRGSGGAAAAVPMAFPGARLMVMWVYFAALRCTRCVGFRAGDHRLLPLRTLPVGDGLQRPGEPFSSSFSPCCWGWCLFLVLGIFLRDLDRAQDRSAGSWPAGAIGLLGDHPGAGSPGPGPSTARPTGSRHGRASPSSPRSWPRSATSLPARPRWSGSSASGTWALFIVLTGVCIGLSGPDERLRHRRHLLRHLPGHRLSPLRGLGHPVPDHAAAACSRCGHHPLHQALHPPALCHLGPRLGERLRRRATSRPAPCRPPPPAGWWGWGAGEGWLHNVAAADTDLVFGMLCEEWGLLIAVMAVGAIIALAFFAVRTIRVGRSSFYTIAACAAGSLFYNIQEE